MFQRILLVFVSFLLLACTLTSLLSSAPQGELPTAIPFESGVGVELPSQVCPTCPPSNCPPCNAASPSVVATLTSPPTETPLPTNTPLPTATPLPSETPVVVLPTAAPPIAQPTSTATESAKPYQLHPGDPFYLQNFARSEQGCNWMGVAGQAFDLNGAPVKNLVTVIEGTLNGIPVDAVGLTGSNPAYGPGGYEIVLSRKPLASTRTLRITLYGLDGKPLSDPIAFDTLADCSHNLVIINFNRVR
ncbi:MAG: hypothetical protein HPY45_00255 [Anaerolineae bacterium]|nr:hypothetical protein [Anaerolineae bacterium]